MTPSPSPSSEPKGRPKADQHISGRSKAEVFGWKPLDSPDVLNYVHKSQIRIDPTYQRQLSEERVLSIAQAFTWLAFGVLSLAEREPGVFFAFDGQHRLEVANRRSDIGELPCNVFTFADVAAEARAFFAANCVRGNVSVFDKVRALLVAGDQLHIDAVALIRERNYDIGRRHAENVVGCLGKFLIHFKRERELLRTTWPLIAELHDGRPIFDKPFSALIYLAKNAEPSINSDEGRDRLFETGYDRIMGSITRTQATFGEGGARVYAQGVINELNKGHRSRRFILRNRDDEDYGDQHAA